MMKKMSSLLILACSMVLLSGCGDKTTVVKYDNTKGTERVIEHVPVTPTESKLGCEQTQTSQSVEVVQAVPAPQTRVIEHTPVTQNYEITVNHDNSQTENYTINHKEIESTEVALHEEENTSVQINQAASIQHTKAEKEPQEEIEEDESSDSFEEMTAKGETQQPIETQTSDEVEKLPGKAAVKVPGTPIPQPTQEQGETQLPTVTPEPTAIPPEPTVTPSETPTPTDSVTPESTKPAAPVVSEWKKIWDSKEESEPKSDGVTYQITWDKITGADGYEVELQSRDSGNEQWSSRTITVTEPSYRESFSHIDMQLKARVRAFRRTGTTKEYGDWSQEKQLNYSPV